MFSYMVSVTGSFFYITKFVFSSSWDTLFQISRFPLIVWLSAQIPQLEHIFLEPKISRFFVGNIHGNKQLLVRLKSSLVDSRGWSLASPQWPEFRPESGAERSPVMTRYIQHWLDSKPRRATKVVFWLIRWWWILMRKVGMLCCASDERFPWSCRAAENTFGGDGMGWRRRRI